MSKTLNMVDELLARARNLQRFGLSHQARKLFQRILSLRQLPPSIAEELQSRLAELAMERRHFGTARRHLTAALAHQPDEADYHYRMALALEEDPDADAKRATRYYRGALALDPTNPSYLCDFGLHLLDRGKTLAGLRCLRAAAAQAADDVDILAALAEALRDHGKADEATRLLRLAMFRNSTDHRLKDLWQQHQFDLLRQKQERAAKVETLDAKEAIILPFKRTGNRSTPPTGGRTLRLDRSSGLRGPKGRTHRNLTRRRNAEER